MPPAWITALPFIALGIVCWQLWNDLLHWHDVVVFAIMYLLTGLGVTGRVPPPSHPSQLQDQPSGPRAAGHLRLGGHRGAGDLLGRRPPQAPRLLRQGRRASPHSPHVGHDGGWRGALKGLLHAHLGWLFIHTQRGNRRRYAPDLVKDPVVSFVDRTFLVWALGGLLRPLPSGTRSAALTAALTGLLWGGGVRMLVVHHVTYSINSLCHFFGRRRFETGDESRNLLWLAPITFGESWHNNHHAFPTSASHGMSRWPVDPSWIVIRAMEAVGLVWDVVRVDPEKMARKAVAEAA